MTSQVTRYASVLDTVLDATQVDLRFTFETPHPGASALEYWARFETREDEARIEELMTLLEKGCHTTNSIRAAVPVLPRLLLNGNEVAYPPSSGVGSPPLPQSEAPWPSPIDANVHLIDTYWREGTSEGHTVHADETTGRGGTSKAPSPLLHFMMGVGFGIGHQTVSSAEQLGFRLNQFSIDVETAYDSRGKMMLGNLYTGGLWFKYTLDLQSPESSARAAALLQHLDSQCPTVDTLRRPLTLIPHILVNTREISYTLPELAAPKAMLEERGFDAEEAVFERGGPGS